MNTRMQKRQRTEAEQKKAAFYIEQGDISLRYQDYNKAIKYYTKAVEADPLQAEAYSKRGSALEFQLKYASKTEPAYKEILDQIIKDYSQAIQLLPTTDAFCRRAEAYRYKEHYQLAIQDCTLALELDPKNLEAYKIRAGIYQFLAESYESKNDVVRKQEYCVQAISDYSQLIQLDRYQATHYYCRGTTYQLAGQYEEAMQDYTQMMLIESKTELIALANSHLADVQTILHQYDRAIKNYDEAIKLNANIPSAYRGRGYTYRLMADACEKEGRIHEIRYLNRKALEDYNQAIHLNPLDSLTIAMQAEVYYSEKNFDNALQQCHAALQINPKETLAYIIRASIRADKKTRFDDKDAIDDCMYAISLSSGDPRPHKILAEIYSRDDSKAGLAFSSMREGFKLEQKTNPMPLKTLVSYFVLSNHSTICDTDAVDNVLENRVHINMEEVKDKSKYTFNLVQHHPSKYALNLNNIYLFYEYGQWQYMLLDARKIRIYGALKLDKISVSFKDALNTVSLPHIALTPEVLKDKLRNFLVSHLDSLYGKRESDINVLKKLRKELVNSEPHITTDAIEKMRAAQHWVTGYDTVFSIIRKKKEFISLREEIKGLKR
ncbi:MAG: tetratricopeptide repeat protein [Gammaproteobacteria bacterium]|nr:MAG: tetratricopeptide repeat protein [Gammaproteobacteria bacterium]